MTDITATVAEAHIVVISATVVALALAAAVLGVVGAGNHQSYVRYDGVNCVYRRTPAFGCGIAGAASLLAGQLIVTAATGCWHRCRRRARPDHRRLAAVFSAVLSWFLAAMSVAAFVVGALRNESGERRPREVGVAACTVLVPGASLLAILAAGVRIASYVALEAAARSAPPRPPCWEERRLDDVAGRPPEGCPANGSAKTMLELFEDDAA